MLIALSALFGLAHAAGYHLFKVEANYGLAEPVGGVEGEPLVEAGFGISPPTSDDFAFWMSFGDASLDDHRVKEWWFESRWYGLQLGDPPQGLDLEPSRGPDWITSLGFGRIGGDRTTRRRFVIDASRHAVVSIPAFFGVPTRHLHFGPSAGLGANLTWWDRWRDTTDEVINTGKVTGEVGWLAGATWRDSVYGQARATWHYDLFGVHQSNLGVAGVVGFFLGRAGRPLGFEVEAQYDEGDDNVLLEHDRSWSLRGVLFVKAHAPDAPRALDEAAQLRELLDELEAFQQEQDQREAQTLDEAGEQARREALECLLSEDEEDPEGEASSEDAEPAEDASPAEEDASPAEEDVAPPTEDDEDSEDEPPRRRTIGPEL